MIAAGVQPKVRRRDDIITAGTRLQRLRLVDEHDRDVVPDLVP
jgi:hypothetical protein